MDVPLLTHQGQITLTLPDHHPFLQQSRHDRIKTSSSRFPNPLDHLVLLRKKEAGWLLFRSWLGCTMPTERLLKEGQAESTRQERVEACQDVIVIGEDSLQDL